MWRLSVFMNVFKLEVIWLSCKDFIRLGMDMDKETQKAWQGWTTFTQFATWSVVIVAGVLGLMALFLL